MKRQREGKREGKIREMRKIDVWTRKYVCSRCLRHKSEQGEEEIIANNGKVSLQLSYLLSQVSDDVIRVLR